MASGAIDYGVVGQVFSIMNENGPEVDKNEEHNVGDFLEREDEWKDVIRERLCETVERMESMARVGRGHNPLVVRFMQMLIYEGMMKVSVDPVNTEIGEE